MSNWYMKIVSVIVLAVALTFLFPFFIYDIYLDWKEKREMLKNAELQE